MAPPTNKHERLQKRQQDFRTSPGSQNRKETVRYKKPCSISRTPLRQHEAPAHESLQSVSSISTQQTHTTPFNKGSSSAAAGPASSLPRIELLMRVMASSWVETVVAMILLDHSLCRLLIAEASNTCTCDGRD